MNLRIVCLVGFLLLPGPCFSQVRPRTPAKQPSAPPAYMQQLKSFDQEGAVTRVVFKNDLTVLVSEAHATPIMEVLAWVRTGRRDEPANLVGISQVMGHRLLRGTATRSAEALAADLKSLGGRVNLSVGYDRTAFRVVVPILQWKRALEIHSDALLHPLFDEGELRRQAGSMTAAMSYGMPDPAGAAEAKLLQTGFAGQGLAQRAGVQPDVPQSITREALVKFYQTGYSPGRIVLIVCGDVTASEVFTEIARIYAGVKGGAAPERRPAAGAAPGLRYSLVRAGEKISRLYLGFRTVPYQSPDYPALEVLRAMLGTGEGSVLNRRLKHQKGFVYDAGAEQFAFDDAGYLLLRMDLDPKDLDRCELAAFTEFEILKNQDEDEAELVRAQAQLAREFWEGTMAVSDRAERLARFECIGAWKNAAGYLERLARVRWADVARVASKYLRLENCAIIETLPAGAEERTVNAETIQNTIRDLLELSTKEVTAEREKEVIPALELPSAGSFKPSEVRYAFKMASILRGPQLAIREDHTIPYLHIGFFYAGGRLSETSSNAGITSLMLRTILRDNKARSGVQNFRELEVNGARMTPVIEDDYFGYLLSISSAGVEAGLNVLSDMLKSPKFDPEEIARQKRLQLGVLWGRSETELACRRVRAALFREFPYALDGDGTEESLESIVPEAVRAWHQEHIVDKKPMVVIVGDTQGTNLAGYFVRNFSGSRFQDVKLPEGFAKALEGKAEIEAERNFKGSLVMVGFQAPPDDDEDSFPLIVLQHYASGLGGRLAERVSAAVPGAISISLDYRPELRGGSSIASLLVPPEAEEAALKVLTDELQRLATATITYRDYRSAWNSAVGDILIRQQDRDRQICDLVKSLVAGKELVAFQDLPVRLQEVRQPDLQEVAKRIYRIDRAVILRWHGKSQ